MYTSPRFRLSQLLADRLNLQYFIVSAKHGLLVPSQKIEPYELNLGSFNNEQRVAWARDVLNQMLSTFKEANHVILLADDEYAAPLKDAFQQKNISVLRPLEGFAKETRLALLKQCNHLLDRTEAVTMFYDLFEQIETKSAIQPLREALQGYIPDQGVYFFFDTNEETRFSKSLGRLVRIGTHGVSSGSKATLRDRLRTHLGTSDGYGNHRSSVFRLHVGEAIIRRDGLRKRFPEWGKGQNSSISVRDSERPLEKKVSDVISQLRVASVEVIDKATKTSARSVIERLTIALFTEHFQPVEAPGSNWLGRHSAHDVIAKTGLWNLRDAGSTADLDVIRDLRERLQQI